MVVEFERDHRETNAPLPHRGRRPLAHRSGIGAKLPGPLLVEPQQRLGMGTGSVRFSPEFSVQQRFCETRFRYVPGGRRFCETVSAGGLGGFGASRERRFRETRCRRHCRRDA
jgi:hypothetical protein